MSIVDENWQTSRPTIKERNKFIFDTGVLSDVKFIVRMNENDECKQLIPAHKFMLSLGSPVFEAMFYGELAETRDAIELPDCEYERLLELFRYMYSDEVNLSGSNVMGVLYLAKKYMVPSLAAKCSEYLRNNLEPSNGFSILPSAQRYEEKSLVGRCWKIVDEQTEEALKSDGFATIERSLLEAVVIKDTLRIEEIELFKAVDLWATVECERQGLAVEGKIKRTILGEKIIKGMRFSLMKKEDFISVVLSSGILLEEEIDKIFEQFFSASSFPFKHPEIKRFGGDVQRCCRFASVPSKCGYSYNGSVNGVSFSVDRDITLLGVCFFGSEKNSYFIELKAEDAKGTPVSKREEYFSEPFQSSLGSYDGLEVLFDRGVTLNKNTAYYIEAKITGPRSWCGDSRVSSVVCSGVTFTFLRSEYCDSTYSNSSVKWGQFPELIFTLS